MRSRTEHRNHRSSGRRIAALIALLVGLVGYGPAPVTAQQWLPAGQMVGPLMWQFPLSLPDGTHLIGLRWVHERNNDSLYWFDIRSFMTEPRMYGRQTPIIKNILDIHDYDSDGTQDLAGVKHTPSATTLFSVLTDNEHTKDSPGSQAMAYGVQTRYFGDIDGDGLNDDFATGRDSEGFARIVYGDREHPFKGPSYVDLPDLRDPLYPDLEPTYVAVVGMLGEKPCLVRLVTERPDWIYYELLELNQEDLQERAPAIRTTSLAKFFPSQPRYGAVVLRTPDVWWLFDGDGKHTSGMKITREEITVMPVPEFWHGGWVRYFGQGGESADYNFPRVMDSDRPIIREDFANEIIDGIGEVQVASISFARVTDPATADIEVLGQAHVPQSQRYSSRLGYVAVVPDVDGDGIDDFMVSNQFRELDTRNLGVTTSLYATSQRPTVSVPEEGAQKTTTIGVIDEGTQWRLMSAASCAATPPEVLDLYDVTGAQVGEADLRPEGLDIMLVKPAALPPVALWARLGSCIIRLQ